MLNTDRLCLGCMNDNGEADVCPICGYDVKTKNPKDALPAKFWINDRYLVGKVISSNGESITYIGWDNAEDSIVSIKEYFPVGCAHRNPDKTVAIDADNKYAFNEGLMSFIEINKALMMNPLSCILPVNAVFEENGTVYAIQPNISAITLREFLTKNGGTLEWEQAKLLFMPLIDDLSKINQLGIIHRGISPETVLVGRDGKLHLTGFAVKGLRTTEGEISAQMYPGYSAIEQYGIEGFNEGSYTDVYGICATLFRTLIGAVPPEATARLSNDSMTIPARFAESLPRNVLSALANGLQVKPADRTENAELLKGALSVTDTSEVAPIHTKKTEEITSSKAKAQSKTNKKKKSMSSAKYAVISAVATALIFLVVGGILIGTVFKDAVFGGESSSAASSDDYASAPSVDQIGSYDKDAVDTVKLYVVPKLLGKYYSEVVDNKDEDSNYDKFKFVIKDKEYSDKYPKGTICSQSVAEGTEVEKETEIQVIISLGPKEIKIANVVGLEPDAAKLELLKQGFLYDNIIVEEMYNSNKAPGTIIEQEPKYGTTINTEIPVTIFVNTYAGATEDTSDTSSTSIDVSNH